MKESTLANQAASASSTTPSTARTKTGNAAVDEEQASVQAAMVKREDRSDEDASTWKDSSSTSNGTTRVEKGRARFSKRCIGVARTLTQRSWWHCARKVKPEEGKPAVHESNEQQEQRRLEGYLAEFRSMYDQETWPWPVVAGSSSESGIDRIRWEVNALQADAGTRIPFGYGTEAFPAEPAHSVSYTRLGGAEGYGSRGRCRVSDMPSSVY